MTKKEIILAEKEKGNLVIMTIEGPITTPLIEFMEQSTEGALYDLNRDDITCLSFVDTDDTWINNYAATQVIKFQAAELGKLRKKLSELGEQ